MRACVCASWLVVDVMVAVAVVVVVGLGIDGTRLNVAQQELAM